MIKSSYNKCLSCSNNKFFSYNYNNHKKYLNYFYFKQIFKYIIFLILSIFKKKLRIRNLFIPFSKILVCNNCGYGKYINSISEDEIKNYYGQSFWNKNMDVFFKNETRDSLNRATGQFSLLKRYLLKKNIKILEIGAGSAQLSKKLKEYNTNYELEVVETGDNWTDYYKKNDLKRISYFYPDTNISKYDVIIASHWLEHVLDLKNTIKELYENLKRDGLLFIEVPNCNKEYWEHDIKDIPHIHFFTKRSLKSIFNDNGFKVNFIDNFGITNKEFYNLNYSSKGMSKELKEKIDTSIRENLHRENGNILRMVAKK